LPWAKPPGARPALSARLNPPTERLGLDPHPSRERFSGLPPLPPHVRLSRAFLIREARGSARRAFGIRPPPASAGVPSGRSLSAPIRHPGRFPETPGPRKTGGHSEAREAWESPVRGRGTVSRARLSLLAAAGFHPRPEDRPRSADPCPGDRSLRGTSSLRAMPAAARRLILASQGHARRGALRFFDPLPPHVGLSRLLRGGVEDARAPSFGLPAPTALSVPGPSPGSRETPVEPGPAGRMFPDFTVREIAKTIPDLLRNPQKRPGSGRGKQGWRRHRPGPSGFLAYPRHPSPGLP
jgi:hypothetical protein